MGRAQDRPWGCPHWARGGYWKEDRKQEAQDNAETREKPTKVPVSLEETVALSLRPPSGQMWREDQNLSLWAPNVARPEEIGEEPKLDPPTTFVSRALENELPLRANQDAACKQARREDLGRPQGKVSLPSRGRRLHWLAPSDVQTLVSDGLWARGQMPGRPGSGKGEGLRWSETGCRRPRGSHPDNSGHGCVGRCPEDSEQKKGQPHGAHGTGGARNLGTPGPLAQCPAGGRRVEPCGNSRSISPPGAERNPQLHAELKREEAGSGPWVPTS